MSLRAVINETLRASMHPAASAEAPYVFPTRRLGIRPGVNADKALSLASRLEDDEVGRKLEVRK